MQAVTLAVVTTLELHFLPYLGGLMGTFAATMVVKWVSEQVVGAAPAGLCRGLHKTFSDTELVTVSLG
ncbi:hypothetical protein IX91_01420 [Vibrio tubiashii ATCC 19109]|uniref:Uncharacterized protein n=1 Tax=Vibrio tubiashii ATCC 19109 TaxID=1051646 RepID=F9TCA2_9VIBR|nr:hypothetical protein IX91_01420 [Vibrio tubiashii ATCC 19109]EGU47960.1 hypothetical protein VITU9109_22731 [Vibrio tubiashii ATCC 19109]EIF03390.1 hypothetical protein VT1337_13712 [Vibrio tubiashii NCIMB 1337 = ATCC 19106]